MSFKTASNDVTRVFWSDMASNRCESRGRGNFVDWACSMTSSATADIESCVTRTYSRAGVGYPSLSTSDRTTSNGKAISLALVNHQLNSTCLYLVAIVDAQVVSLARFQFCQGTCFWAHCRVLRWWWVLMSYWRVYKAPWIICWLVKMKTHKLSNLESHRVTLSFFAPATFVERCTSPATTSTLARLRDTAGNDSSTAWSTTKCDS